MKFFYPIIASLLVLTFGAYAQAPNSLNYQGVVRNASGIVIPNQNISLRFTIHQGTATGTVVYQETQSATTNSLGLYTVGIGEGTVVSGNFSTIAWSANLEFLQVEADPTGGSSYLNLGTNQFLSVPYAFNTGKSASGWNLTGNSSTNSSNYIGTTDANDLIIKTNASTNPNPNIQIANGTGDVGVNTSTPVNTLDVNGSKAIGTYAGTTPAAPANGLIVSGQVGVGTNSPNAGAALDITSSTKGFLMPRLASNPTSPAQSMMYYNTTSGCFMFYTGTAWQPIVCPCPNALPSPGTISGPTAFCPSLSGVVYSVAPISNAISYNWTLPAGFIITSGSGTNAITVTTGTTSGTITAAGVNNCGTGTTSSLSVTVGAAMAITVQPQGEATTAGGTATFTVTATGTISGYQWQLNTGSGFNNIPGATNTSYAVSGATLGMNGYQYRVIITGTGPCSPATSNLAALAVCSGTPSVQIAIQNNQSTPTPANFAQMLTLNSASYASYESTGLTNVIFTTGPDGTGSPLQAWIESGNTTTSTATVYWVNLGSNTIAANSTLNIYMSFTGTGLSAIGPTGEAPQLSGSTTPSYGSLDNGTLVFPEFYDNFAGSTLSSNWSKATASNDGTPNITTTVNNGLSLTTAGSSHPNWFGIYETKFSAALNNVADSYCTFGSGGGICITTTGNAMTGTIISNGVNGGGYPSDGFDAQLTAAGGNNYSIANHGSCQTAPSANGASVNTGVAPTAGTLYVLSFYMVYPPIDYVNYGAFSTYNFPIDANSVYCSISPTSEVGLGASAAAGTFQWFRIRPVPPNNVTPSVTTTFGCF